MSPQEAIQNAPLKVLLVDDEALFRSVARSMLNMLGCEVLEAVDGLQAVQLIQREQPAVEMVISDFRMPGMDGVDTLKTLASLCPGVKTILTSGAQEEDCLQGRTLENCIFLGKPFGLKDLNAAMNRAMAKLSS